MEQSFWQMFEAHTYDEAHGQGSPVTPVPGRWQAVVLSATNVHTVPAEQSFPSSWQSLPAAQTGTYCGSWLTMT
jgi:hypothetical protein